MNLASSVSTLNEFGEEETNDVVIRGYNIIGGVQGLGKIAVEAREAVIPDKKIVAYFVRLEVESGDEYPRSAFAMISYDKISKTLNALERLEGANIRTDRFSFTEVEYDVDGAKFIVFNDQRGRIMFCVVAGGVTAHFTSLAQLADIRLLIGKAKAHIDQHRVAF